MMPIHTTPPATRRSRGTARGAGRDCAGGCGRSASAAQVATQTFTPTRSRADDARGFAALSDALGRIALRDGERS